jgi:outer membrane immunogenic protein
MKRMVVAGALALAAAGPAFAADLPQAGPPPPPVRYIPDPLYDWGGVYFGGNGGWSYFSQSGSTNTLSVAFAGPPGVSAGPLPIGMPVHSNSFGGGGQIGAQFQATQWVLGIEADADYLNNKALINAVDAAGGGVTHTYKLDILSTVRGRLGYTFDRVMLYGTAGVAVGHYQVTRTQNTAGLAPASTNEVDNNLRFGWTAGAGLEYGITEYLTARVEYLFADLEKANYTFPVSNITQQTPFAYVQMVRGGLNLKFGPF